MSRVVTTTGVGRPAHSAQQRYAAMKRTVGLTVDTVVVSQWCCRPYTVTVDPAAWLDSDNVNRYCMVGVDDRRRRAACGMQQQSAVG